MVITQSILNQLSEQAKASPRLRMAYDLRNTPEDGSQRLLNAVEPGTVMPIHRHQKTSETIACLRGRFIIEFYDELDGSAGSPQAICTESIELSPNGEVVAVNVPAGQWHSLRCLEPNTVLLECKNGKYEPLTDADVLKV